MPEIQHDQLETATCNVLEELASLRRQLEQVEREQRLELELARTEYQSELDVMRREHLLQLGSVEAKFRDSAERSGSQFKEASDEREKYADILAAKRVENARLRCAILYFSIWALVLSNIKYTDALNNIDKNL